MGGGSLWVMSGKKPPEYRGVARFLSYLSRPEVQAQWHQATGFLLGQVLQRRVGEQSAPSLVWRIRLVPSTGFCQVRLAMAGAGCVITLNRGLALLGFVCGTLGAAGFAPVSARTFFSAATSASTSAIVV